MIEYTLAAAAAMVATISVAALQGLLARRAYWFGLAGFAALTVISDSILVANGVFTFNGRYISGIRIGPMPIEDLLYGAALYSLAVSAYEWSADGWRKLSELFRASRPFSWINTALPCLACGIAVGRPTAALVLGTLYFLAPYNLLLYGANDTFDYDSDRRNPRKNGALEGGLVPPHRRVLVWSVIALTNVPVLALLAWLGGPLVGAALATTVAVALIYSVPPLRTKEVPGLDALTSSLHFVLPCACGALLAGASVGAMPWRYLAAFLLWGAASQALGAIQDVEFDHQAGIGSIAVTLGARTTAALSALLYSGAAALVASAGGLAVAAAVALLPYPLLATSCLAGDAQMQARRAWKGFLGMNLLSGFLITQVLLRAWGVGRVTVLEMLAWGSAAGVLALIGIFAANRLRMRRTAGRAGPERVTVIVPVRDEEARIASCLQVLPRDAEVIVVDDGSLDRTMTVAAALIGPRGSVVSAGERPSGWTGKCWAAWRGAELASGDFLVFLDADTRISDAALGSAASEVALRGGLVSFLTRYEMPTLAERALMPAFALMQLALWPQALLPLAYGPFLVARRTEYMELGGHRAIAGSDREEVDLARLFAAAGRPVRLLHGADLGATRHYSSTAQVAAAWRRMYYAYCGHSLAIGLAGIMGLATVFLVPGFAFVAAWIVGDRAPLLGASVGLLGLFALLSAVAVSERQPLSIIAWHPITWAATLWAMCLSVADGLRGRRPVWRGTEVTGQAR